MRGGVVGLFVRYRGNDLRDHGHNEFSHDPLPVEAQGKKPLRRLPNLRGVVVRNLIGYGLVQGGLLRFQVFLVVEQPGKQSLPSRWAVRVGPRWHLPEKERHLRLVHSA